MAPAILTIHVILVFIKGVIASDDIDVSVSLLPSYVIRELRRDDS